MVICDICGNDHAVMNYDFKMCCCSHCYSVFVRKKTTRYKELGFEHYFISRELEKIIDTNKEEKSNLIRSLDLIVKMDWGEVSKNIKVSGNTIYFRLQFFPQAVMYYRKGNWFILLCEEFKTKYDWTGPFPYTPPTGPF